MNEKGKNPVYVNMEYDDITSSEDESDYEKIQMDVKKCSKDQGDVRMDDCIVISDSDSDREDEDVPEHGENGSDEQVISHTIGPCLNLPRGDRVLIPVPSDC